ncbi:MAG: hypothetical protein CSA44_00545 [Gammaproteobacteria bacterium]|nr:MAG: hypothetical protein CSA44_00545 [Gammaproteobacteria bacterium]
MKIIGNVLLLLACCFAAVVSANDAVYYMHGNQLIPLQQNDISVRKEILTITEQKNKQSSGGIYDREFLVDVDYIFYNPTQETTVLMGFEASAPSLLDDEYQVETMHPFLDDFSVVLNGEKLSYKTALVADPLHLARGKITSITPQQAKKRATMIGEGGGTPYRYAYYFNATFKPGENRLRHRYRFAFGADVMLQNELGYLLTPANRWANKQIDDFTLNIHLLSPKNVFIERTFFDDAKHWSSDGRLVTAPYQYYENKMMQFNSEGTTLTFKQKAFHPKGELFLAIPRPQYMDAFKPSIGPDTNSGTIYCFSGVASHFDELLSDLGYYKNEVFNACVNATPFERKVLRNLPFAKRGYVFRDKKVQRYYQDNQPWYAPNPDYRPDMSKLTNQEAEWVRHWR